jgi:hypothetical protein
MDSGIFEFYIDENISDEQYLRSNFPRDNLGDEPHRSGDFRDCSCISPLTGAGLIVTALGQVIPNNISDERFMHGRIAGYSVSINPPAVLIGHNRFLTVGTYQSGVASFWLLRYWLAINGCTKEGIESIRFDNAEVAGMTHTYLKSLETVALAKKALADFRSHSETLLNEKSRKGEPRRNKVAYSIPEKPNGPLKDYEYSSYVLTRTCKLLAYIKPVISKKAYLLPLDDDELEQEMQSRSSRTLRIETQVLRAWLKSNGLNLLSAWKNNPKANERVFSLVRQTLRLDENLRARAFRKSSVPKLDLSDRAKKYLLMHLDKVSIRDLPEFGGAGTLKEQQAYSAFRSAIRKASGIDIEWEAVKQTRGLSDWLPKLLVFEGDYEPPATTAGYEFSRTSVPVAIRELREICTLAIRQGPKYTPALPFHTPYRGPIKRRMGKVGFVSSIPDAEFELLSGAHED